MRLIILFFLIITFSSLTYGGSSADVMHVNGDRIYFPPLGGSPYVPYNPDSAKKKHERQNALPENPSLISEGRTIVALPILTSRSEERSPNSNLTQSPAETQVLRKKSAELLPLATMPTKMKGPKLSQITIVAANDNEEQKDRIATILAAEENAAQISYMRIHHKRILDCLHAKRLGNENADPDRPRYLQTSPIEEDAIIKVISSLFKIPHIYEINPAKLFIDLNHTNKNVSISIFLLNVLTRFCTKQHHQGIALSKIRSDLIEVIASMKNDFYFTGEIKGGELTSDYIINLLLRTNLIQAHKTDDLILMDKNIQKKLFELFYTGSTDQFSEDYRIAIENNKEREKKLNAMAELMLIRKNKQLFFSQSS